LLFKQLTKAMTKILVMDSATKLNFFPAKQGISPYYSPRMILHQKNLDYSKNCKTTFGSFVQAHDKLNPKNDNSPRTLDCIYLRYTDSHQGGHELLHLPTNQVITRRNITKILITKAIQDQVADLAIAEDMPQGLKITSKTDTVIYDSSWIAGVDYPLEEEVDYQEHNEMHPDKIAGLTSEKIQDVNNETVEQELTKDLIGQDQPMEPIEQDSEIKIKFEDDDKCQEDEIEDHPGEPLFDRLTRTPSERVSRPVHKFVTQHHSHLQTQAANSQEYMVKTAKVIAKTIDKLNHQFAQTYSLKRDIKEFGKRGHKAAHEEMKQLHNRVVFIPILIKELTNVEIRRAMESLIFLTEKKDGRIKAKTCANGSTQQKYTDRDEAASPTAMAKLHIITAVIEAKQG
jgi:hypothetical protein